MLTRSVLGMALALSVVGPMTSTSAFAIAPSANVKTAISDTVITGKVKALYAKSKMLKEQPLSVTTANYKVALSGEVKTNSQYERAIVLAGSVKGVRYVIADDLRVKSSDAPLADSYITAKVKSKFFNEKLFGSKDIQVWPIKVETKDSIVYLSGQVNTLSERKNIIKLARKVDGVKAVKSAIVVG